MKIICSFTLLILFSTCASAQVVKQVKPAKPDTIVPGKGPPEEQLKVIKEKDIKLHSDSIANVPKKQITVDTTTHNKYNNLLNDDPAYNKRYHWSIPATEILGINVLTWGLDKYILNADYANISLSTWKYNLQTGWEWDIDRFGVNFLGHQYSGSLYFNAARSNGYNYYQSIPFAIGGSLIYEYFGENTLPSYNDFVITPITGAFLGEILYRLSSNVLDD